MRACLFLTAFGVPALLTTAHAQEQLSLKAQAVFEKQMLALKSEKASRTPAQLKLDSQFVYALRERKLGAAISDAPGLKPQVDVEQDDRVAVDLSGKITPVLLEEIRKLGGEIINSHPDLDAARVKIPLGQMETLAARPEVRFIGPALKPQTNATAGEGVRTHRAGFVHGTYNILGGTTKVNGTGIKVGVISDSDDYLEAARAAGDVPNDSITLPGQSGRPATGEGTAMMEIVNEMAPGAKLYYATALGGAAQFAANIRALRDAGCQVIVDDITYGNESPFQDDVISQAVNDVCAGGVLFFSSATNSGNKNDGTSSTWEGDFSALGNIAGVGPTHNWGGSNHNKFTQASAAGDNVTLFWSDPLGASSNDYDLFVVNDAGTILRSSTNPQTGTQNPFEFISTISVGENVVVARVSGANRFLHLEVGRGRIQYSTAGRTRGHNAAVAANAFSVAAVDVAGSASPAAFTGGATNPVEPFSSDGPRRMFFSPNGTALTPGNFSSTGGVVYNKPDIAAADGVANSGVYPASVNLSPFFGTSAAAPHAAAIAALMLSYNPALTPAQIRSALQDTALDIEATGYDRDSGYGLVMADRALKQVMFQSDTTPPTGTIGSPLAGTITVPTNLVFSGTATDNQQFMSLMLYLKRNSDGKYWNGSGWQSADFSLPGSYNATNGNWGCTATLPPVGGSSPNALLNGSYTFFIKLEDAAGRTAEVQSVVTVQLAGPAVAVTTPAHNSFISGFTAISGTATDSGAGIAGNTVNLTLYQVSTGKYWNGTAWSSSASSLSVPVTAGTWNYTGTLPNNSGNSLAGQYTLSASTLDNNGTPSPAVAGVNNIQFTVDTTPPVASISAPANGSTMTTYSYPFTGGATDNKEINRVVLFIRRNSDGLYWDGGAWIAESLSANLSSSYNAASDTWTCTDTLPIPGNTLTNGSYNFIALAFDDAGNSHQADSLVTVDYHQIYNWTAGSYGDSDPNNNNLNWGNPANWSPNGVPSTEDIVYIDRNESINSTVPRTVYGFHMSTGNLYFDNGSHSLTIRKSGSWTGGTLNNTIFIEPAATFALSGGDYKWLAAGGVMQNSGTVTWAGPGAIRGNNGSIWNNKSGSTFTMLTDGDLLANYNGGNIFNNEPGSSFTKSTGAGEGYIDEWTFNNGGGLQCQAGTLHFNTTLNLGSGSAFAGPGIIRLNGTTNLTGSLTSTGNPELVGTLNATTATFAGTNPFVWSSGAITGNFTLQAGSVMNLAGDTIKDIASSTTFTNHGRINFLAGVVRGNNLTVLNNESGGIFDMKTDGDVFANYNGGNTFNNKAGGLFLKSGKSAAPDGETYLDEWTFNNYGTVRSDNGVMRFHLPLWLYGGGTISRNGSLAARVRSSHYFVLTGTTTVSNVTFESTGDWHGNLDVGTAGNGTIATQSGGVFEWANGTAHNTVNIAAGSTFLISGTETKWIGSGGILNNSGNATWSGTGPLRGFGSSSFVNLSGATFTATNDSDWNNHNGNNVFSNRAGATFSKTAGTEDNRCDWAFDNHGTVLVSSGALAMNGGGTSTGTFNPTGTGRVQFTAGTHLLQTTAKFQGSGKTQFLGGPVVAVNAINLGSTATTFDIAGGTVTSEAAGSFNAIGTVNWTSGSIGGTFNVPSGSSMHLSGDPIKQIEGQSVINNSGTATWTGPGVLRGNNGSVWNNKPGSSFTMLTDGDVLANYNSGNTFNNEAGATFAKGAASGTGDAYIDEWTFTNSGTLSSQQGRIHFNTGLYLNTGSSFAGAGGILVNGTTYAAGTITSTGNPELVGVFNANAVTFSGANPFVWSSGAITGNFTLQAGSVMNLTSGAIKDIANSTTFTNYGRINFLAGVVRGNNLTVLNNESGGIFDMKTDGDVFANYNGGNTFNNKAGGLFLKSGKSAAPDGETYLDEWSFNNWGTIRNDTGVMRFHLPVWLYGGGTISRNGALAAKVRSTHYFVLVGTTTVSNITFETTGDWHGNLEPGTSGNGTIATQSGGVFEWTGGTAHNTVNIAAGSTFSIAGPDLKWIGGGGVLNNGGTATRTGTGALQGWGSSTLVNLPGAVFNVSTSAPFTNYNGNNRFTNSGTLNLGTGAMISPMHWSFTQTSTGKINVEIGGTVAATPEFDQLNISGDAVLAGSIGVTLVNGFAPVANAEFPVITFGGGRTGTFASVTAAGSSWSLKHDPNSVSVVAQTKPTNYAAWATFHFTNPALADALASADPDKDGLVNLVEYALGFNPKGWNKASTTAGVIDISGVRYLTLTYTRPAGSAALTDVSYQGERSAPLTAATWSGAGVTTVSTTMLPSGEEETVVLRSTQAITAAAKDFIRLKVVVTPAN